MKRTDRPYFEGWYFKVSNGTQTLAFIPSYHVAVGGKLTAFLQIITGEKSWQIQIAPELLPRMFSGRGCRVALHAPVKLRARLKFGPLTPLSYDIMGPFRYVPFMQCRHGVFSLLHRVDGTVVIDGERFEFRDGIGYIEGDRGISFPKKYLWTQYNDHGACVMIAAATIPFLFRGFTGCLGVVYVHGRQYRLATYLGARVVCAGPSYVELRQGKYTLTARMLDEGAAAQLNDQPAKQPANGGAQGLYAPECGQMTRVIHENIACRVHYRFLEKERVIYECVGQNASFESDIYVCPEDHL